ncbi:helix-turn-helix domain-containing protein [Salmonella enterica]
MKLIDNASKINVKREYYEDACAVIHSCIESSLFLLTEEEGDYSHSITQLLLVAQKRANSICAPTNYLYQSLSLPETIAFRIQLARENLGLSEADLAEKLDIHPGDVLTWEDGTDQPLAGMIIPLSNALKCDPMWLLTGETTRQYPATPVHQSRNQYSGQQRSAASDHASHHVKHQSQA